MAISERVPIDRRALSELTARAQHATRRYSLYRAKMHSSRPSSPGRLRVLKRDAERAQARLERAGSDA